MRYATSTLTALALLLALNGCDSLSDIVGEDEEDLTPQVTQALLSGKVIFFTPDVPQGGIPNWEYEFNAGSAKGCNIENVYYSTGWDVFESEKAIRVYFGPGKTQPWEQYTLVDFQGDLTQGNLSGRFQYTSSPGVTMAGQFIQVSSTSWC